MNTPALKTTALAQYGLIALPVAFAGFPLYILAPDFYATQHGVSLTLLGVLLLVIRLFDAVQDPVIGWLTDRLQGRIMTLVTVAGAALCLAVLGLFNTVLFSPAAWFAIAMVVAISAYSVLTIVLGAQATLWTTNERDQTRIAGAREAFGLIGLVIAVSTPAALAQITDATQVYLWYGVILCVLMLLGVIAFSRVVNVKSSLQPDTAPVSLFSGLRALPQETRKLLAVYALSMLASSIPAVLVIFYVRDLLVAEHLTGLFLLLYFLTGAAGMPLWKKLSVRVGKYAAWAIANALAVAGFIAAYFLGVGDVWAYALVCMVSGLALGADLTLPPSILADSIHAHGNRRYAGTHYALLAFITKASLAVASAVSLPLLDIAGFVPQAENTAAALGALSLTYALVPCLLKLMAAGWLYLFFVRVR